MPSPARRSAKTCDARTGSRAFRSAIVRAVAIEIHYLVGAIPVVRIVGDDAEIRLTARCASA